MELTFRPRHYCAWYALRYRSMITSTRITRLLLNALTLLAGMSSIAVAEERPNIVWLTSEDNSKHWLRLYSESGAPMPHIERLAQQGFVFENAFSNAPVCSVARSTIITGCYAPRIGAQYHRRAQLAPMPDGLRMFPYYLRQAGYYTTNNVKTDYNLKDKGMWDESSKTASYRNREQDQPFFHVQNNTITHEGWLHFSAEEMATVENRTNPETITPFPYHPNTPTFRYTYARYLDQHLKLDEQTGAFLDQLEADGLMEDTIIFYYGDHGGVLPRGKGYAYESGLNVPLIVYVPNKWRHLASFESYGKVTPFVSFIDLAPTVLNLAGAQVPEQMDGKPFLGSGVSRKDLDARDETFGYADRFDEKYDFVRTLRKGRFKYMRNYQPFNFDGLHNEYRYRMLAYQEWKELYHAGKLDPIQSQFFQSRPPECLYDVENDPHETNNLADDPDYASVLEDLRQRLVDRVKSLPDLSFYPESVLIEQGIENPVQFGQDRKEDIAQLVDIADLSLTGFRKAKPALRKALKSNDPWQRYWGLIVCSSYGNQARAFKSVARDLAAADPEPLVRARAAEFLGLAGIENPANYLVDALRDAQSDIEAHLILNTVALLRDSKPGYDVSLSRDIFPSEWLEASRSNVNRRLDYLLEKKL